MNLFNIAGSDLTLHADILSLPVIHKIWTEYKDKSEALNMARYIILNNHPLSPYVKSYLEKDRMEVLKSKLLRGIKYDEDVLKKDEAEFIELFDTLSTKTLRYMRKTLDRLISEEIESSKMSIEDAVEIQPKLEKVITSIARLEEVVRMELSAKSKIKGGYKLGILEESDGLK